MMTMLTVGEARAALPELTAAAAADRTARVALWRALWGASPSPLSPGGWANQRERRVAARISDIVRFWHFQALPEEPGHVTARVLAVGIAECRRVLRDDPGRAAS